MKDPTGSGCSVLGTSGEGVPEQVKGVGIGVQLTLALPGEDPGKQLQWRVVVVGQRHQTKVRAAGQASFNCRISGGAGADQGAVHELGAQQRQAEQLISHGLIGLV